jgi:hypothetical protein
MKPMTPPEKRVMLIFASSRPFEPWEVRLHWPTFKSNVVTLDQDDSSSANAQTDPDA